MLQKEYWISELAALSGVSTRTIRYYIQEGLLPQPEIRGKYAVFTDEYMHRLQLIKWLKDAYLPLNRIGELLNTLTEDQVIPLLKQFEVDPVAALSILQALPVFSPLQSNEVMNDQSIQIRTKNVNALEYINQLRLESPLFEKPESTRKYEHRQPPQPSPQTPPTGGEEWRHITLAPGVNLQVRQPVNPRVQRFLDELLEFARKHF